MNESATLREIVNEPRERAMYEQMEQIKRQLETLTIVLHELREAQRRFGRRSLGENQDIPISSDRPNRGKQNLAMRNQLHKEQNSKVGSQLHGEQNHRTEI